MAVHGTTSSLFFVFLFVLSLVAHVYRGRVLERTLYLLLVAFALFNGLVQEGIAAYDRAYRIIDSRDDLAIGENEGTFHIPEHARVFETDQLVKGGVSAVEDDLFHHVRVPLLSCVVDQTLGFLDIALAQERLVGIVGTSFGKDFSQELLVRALGGFEYPVAAILRRRGGGRRRRRTGRRFVDSTFRVRRCAVQALTLRRGARPGRFFVLGHHDTLRKRQGLVHARHREFLCSLGLFTI